MSVEEIVSVLSTGHLVKLWNEMLYAAEMHLVNSFEGKRRATFNGEYPHYMREQFARARKHYRQGEQVMDSPLRKQVRKECRNRFGRRVSTTHLLWTPDSDYPERDYDAIKQAIQTHAKANFPIYGGGVSPLTEPASKILKEQGIERIFESFDFLQNTPEEVLEHFGIREYRILPHEVRRYIGPEQKLPQKRLTVVGRYKIDGGFHHLEYGTLKQNGQQLSTCVALSTNKRVRESRRVHWS